MAVAGTQPTRGGAPPGMSSGSPRRARRAHPLRHTYAMTLLGTLAPGAGLLRTRARRFGTLLLLLAALVLLLLVYKVVTTGLVGSALELGVSRSALLVLIWCVIGGAALWMLSIAMTAALTRSPRLTRDERLASTMVAFLCCLAVAAPSAYAVHTLGVQRSLVDEVFAPDQDRSGGNGGSASGGAPEVGQDDPWASVPRVNLLLLGSDAGVSRVGVRTDSMMVASIDTRTGDTVLIGVPRNLENAPIPASNPLSTLYPDGYNCGDECLINGIWTLATDNAALFPGETNPGLRSIRDVIGEVLGLRIDNTVVVDLSGFADLVDAMGGVEINVQERVCIGCKALSDGTIVGTTAWIEPGVQRLDGYRALWYARSRATTDDFSRMRRQRCVTGALIAQVNPGTMLLRYPALATVLKEHVSVDIAQSHLSAWVPLVEKIQAEGRLRSLPLTNKVIDVGNPDYPAIHALVANATSANPITPSASATPSPSGSPSPATSPATSDPTEPDDTLNDLAATC